jgi:hypothetical protein
MSIPSQAALTHLRSIKPDDGWVVEKNENGLQLLRLNVPLSDTSFLDIHHDPEQDIVVGVMTSDGQTCQVLVDHEGKPVSNVRVVSVSTYVQGNARNADSSKTRSNESAPRSRSVPEPAEAGGKNSEMTTKALMFVGLAILARVSASFKLLFIFGIILLFLHMFQTCPTMQSFDAKKELKRVLRGHHLPEGHPDKPKGFFEDLAARVTASAAAELATLPGYELTMTPFGGVATLAEVRVPTAKTSYFWVGAFGQWHYVYSREIPQTHCD